MALLWKEQVPLELELIGRSELQTLHIKKAKGEKIINQWTGISHIIYPPSGAWSRFYENLGSNIKIL